MIVVSNSSPIMNLAVVGQLQLLKQLYGKVCIPETVWQELSAIGSEQAWVTEMQTSSWLEKQSVGDRSLVDLLMLELDSGESEAIALAIEIKADLLLLDERQARKVAYRLGLKFIGRWGFWLRPSGRGSLLRPNPLSTT